MSSAAERIRGRNQRLREIEQESLEAVEEFYQENREEIEGSGHNTDEDVDADEILDNVTKHNSIDDPTSISERDSSDDEKPTATIDLDGDGSNYQDDLKDRFEKLVNEETAFSWMGGSVKRDIESVRDEDGFVMPWFQADNTEISKLEQENYVDYFEHVSDELDLEDPDAAYLGAGHDLTPALAIGGDWKYVGLGYDRENLEENDTSVDFINQDLTEGLPQIEDGTLDLVLIKTLGSVPEELDETVKQEACNKVSDNGYVVSDRQLEDMEEVESIEPVSETFSERLFDIQTGNMTYNASELTIYQKKGD